MKKKWGLWLIGAAVSLSVAATSHAAEYTVKHGDSLWNIATTHSTTVANLMQLNSLSSTILYPGQRLQVPDRPNTYIVKDHNDTLWKISQRHGISLNALIRANPHITNPDNIWPGLAVRIPQKPPAFSEGSFPLRKGTYEPYWNNYADARTWSADGTEIRQHEGIDIFAKKGTPVYNVLDGTITRFGWNEYGGWRVTIKVNEDTSFYYAHLSGYADGLEQGAYVRKGQLLGYVGDTGYGPVGTSGKFVPHLHFGIYKHNPWRSINPYVYLNWWELNTP